jgi:hypothetical protein
MDATNNTIVIFTADHGYQLGEHNEWEKFTNFELGTRVYGARFHHGFRWVRVSIIGVWRMYGARFREGFTLKDAIEFHAFAPLEALPCA